MLIIAGWLQVDPDARDRYLQQCQQVVALARAAPGCLDFSLSADLLDPARINIHERWASDEQLLAFRGSGPDAGQTEQIRAAEVLKYRISAIEPP
jgi:quinol monooxygenase YgiN